MAFALNKHIRYPLTKNIILNNSWLKLGEWSSFVVIGLYLSCAKIWEYILKQKRIQPQQFYVKSSFISNKAKLKDNMTMLWIC